MSQNFLRLSNPWYSPTPPDTTAFDTCIVERDSGCVLCGLTDEVVLDCCYIVPQSDAWELMRSRGYIPRNAKKVRHECRNGVRLCGTHHRGFEICRFYIRWIFETNEFIVVNHSRMPDYEDIHGKVLHFDTNTKCCPFPTAFLWHESFVRSRDPTLGDRLVTVRRGVNRTVFFGSRVVRTHDEDRNTGSEHTNTMTFTPMPLEGEKLASWLQASRQHSSWKECVIEITPWDGSAEENISVESEMI